jgi:hypothetical protein
LRRRQRGFEERVERRLGELDARLGRQLGELDTFLRRAVEALLGQRLDAIRHDQVGRCRMLRHWYPVCFCNVG